MTATDLKAVLAKFWKDEKKGTSRNPQQPIHPAPKGKGHISKMKTKPNPVTPVPGDDEEETGEERGEEEEEEE